jgi:hypothetical protein
MVGVQLDELAECHRKFHIIVGIEGIEA